MTVLKIERVAKTFGATVALSDVSLTINSGEVHALLGENGAGKSTLLSIIAGLCQPDSGTLELGGEPFAPENAFAARAAGIAIVPQEPTLALDLSVHENVTLGREPLRFGLVDRNEARKITRKALKILGASIEVDGLAGSLSPAERQIVSIARALSQGGARLLVLDEPTSSLSTRDAHSVLEAVRRLTEAGKTIIYVSHHLAEVKEIATRFTVMRAGAVVATRDVATANVSDMAELMLGRSIASASNSTPRKRGEVVLSLRSLAGRRLPHDASFDLCRGEILGVAGLVGAGRTELCRAIFGLDAIHKGTVRIGSNRPDSGAPPWQRLKSGVGLLSEDRKSEGLVTAMSLADNVTLSNLGAVMKRGLVSRTAQYRATANLLRELGIRASGPDALASSLSGGNQQKVAIARLLFRDVDVFLLDEPTRGIDPASRESIYKLFERLAEQGKAILWVSSQPQELMRVCDRIAVMYRGCLSELGEVSLLDESRLLAACSGLGL